MDKFCGKYEDVPKDKEVGLFVCGMLLSKKEDELEAAYPDYLHNIALAEGFMGADITLERWVHSRKRQ